MVHFTLIIWSKIVDICAKISMTRYFWIISSFPDFIQHGISPNLGTHWGYLYETLVSHFICMRITQNKWLNLRPNKCNASETVILIIPLSSPTVPERIDLGCKLRRLRNKLYQLWASVMPQHYCGDFVRKMCVHFYLTQHIPVSVYKVRHSIGLLQLIPQTLESFYRTHGLTCFTNRIVKITPLQIKVKI